MPGGFSDTGPVTYATSGVAAPRPLARWRVPSKWTLQPRHHRFSLTPPAWDSSIDEYYAEYDSLTAFYGMDYATKFGSYSSYYTA